MKFLDLFAQFQDLSSPHCSKCLHKKLESEKVNSRFKCEGSQTGVICIDYVPPLDSNLVKEVKLFKRKLI